MYGKDYPYAQTRIQGTVLRLLETGEPVYILNVANNGLCHAVPIEKVWGDPNQALIVHVDELNMHPVPLGYVNCAGMATYLMRVPMRRDWKQGLRSENCMSSGRRFDQIPMKDVKNCIMNKYPSFANACKDVQVGTSKGKKKSIAWHRHWCVNTDGDVFYKNNEKVGKLLANGGKVVLDSFASYLREALEESGNVHGL